MTIKEIQNILPVADGFIKMELYDCIIPIEGFIARFESSELNCESLCSHHNATPGWINQFNNWKEQGILSH